jgi:hypothetical protein
MATGKRVRTRLCDCGRHIVPVAGLALAFSLNPSWADNYVLEPSGPCYYSLMLDYYYRPWPTEGAWQSSGALLCAAR